MEDPTAIGKINKCFTPRIQGIKNQELDWMMQGIGIPLK
jgi:hypothetical protein